MNDLIGLSIGLVLFLSCIKAYTLGYSHAKELAKGNTPKLSLNPIRPIIKAVEKHKEDKKIEELTDELSIAMGYSRESALEFVKKER